MILLMAGWGGWVGGRQWMGWVGGFPAPNKDNHKKVVGVLGEAQAPARQWVRMKDSLGGGNAIACNESRGAGREC